MKVTPDAVIEITSTSPEVTEALGEGIGAVAGAGLVIGLRGPLGSGKTCLVRGIGRGLGIDGTVCSPTFTICNLHRAPLPLFHVDAYRLEDARELWLHGWDEMIASAVVVVEWADRVEEALPADHLDIEMSHRGAKERLLRVSRATEFPPGNPVRGVWDFLEGSRGGDS